MVGSAEKEPAPNKKNKYTNGPHSTEKKKKLVQNKKKHSKEKKKTVWKETNPALRSSRVTYHLPDHSASGEVHEIPAIHYTGTF